MNFWLMKSEPDVFSIDDLKREKKTGWDSVRNYQARNFMRDEMQLGDLVLFYHSNAEPSGVAGVAKIVGPAVPDPLQFDTKSEYYDARSTKADPAWLMVTVGFVRSGRTSTGSSRVVLTPKQPPHRKIGSPAKRRWRRIVPGARRR